MAQTPTTAPSLRVVPWIAAVGALVLVLAATHRHGLGVSLDSVAYARSAERLMEHGALEVPTTWWDSDAVYAPLSHFPPALPVVLAALGRGLGVEARTAGRWLNAGAAGALVLILLLPVADSVAAMLGIAVLLAGPAFLTTYLWLWSEPLFLLFLAVGVRLAARACRTGATSAVVWLGIVAGAATLTRYAGLALGAGFAVVLVASRRPPAAKLRQVLWYGGAYAAVMMPWAWWLSTIAGAPRALGFYADHAWSEIVLAAAGTVVHWFVPASSRLPTGPIFLAVATGLVAAGIAAFRRARVEGDLRIDATVWIAAVLLVVYALFLVSARLLVDPGMPLDERILSPALALTALGLGGLARAAFPAAVPLVPGIVLAALVAANLAATAGPLRQAARDGLGYASDEWGRSETLGWLRATADPARTIFSNAPDLICAWLPVTAKFTPADHESARLGELAARVERSAPAVVVLFADPHVGWLMPRARLTEALRAPVTRTFADGVVLGWDAPRS